MTGGPPSYDYVAYIDEAGDTGINHVKPRSFPGASEWFIVSGALIRARDEPNVSGWIQATFDALRSRQLRDIHFQKLNDERKRIACSMIAGTETRFFVIISNKQNMQGYKNLRAASIPSDNWFYCWMTRVLLERITDYVYADSIKRYGEPRHVKLEYSERGGLRYSQMQAYYEWIRLKSSSGAIPLFLPWGRLRFEVLHHELFNVFRHELRDGLKLADIAASAFFKAVDVHDTGACNPEFAKLLTPRMAAAPATNQIGGYGVKLLPKWKTLNDFDVPSNQRVILRHFGYPSNYWFDKEFAVDPGSV